MVSCCGEQKRLARSQPDRSAALQTVSGCQDITLIMLCRLCMVSGPHTIAALRGCVKTSYLIHCCPAGFVRVSGLNQALPSYCCPAAMLSGLQGYSLLLPCRRCAVSGSCTIFLATTSLFATLQDGPEPPSGLQCFEARYFTCAQAAVCAAQQIHRTRASRWAAKAMITPRLRNHQQSGAALQSVAGCARPTKWTP